MLLQLRQKKQEVREVKVVKSDVMTKEPEYTNKLDIWSCALAKDLQAACSVHRRDETTALFGQKRVIHFKMCSTWHSKCGIQSQIMYHTMVIEDSTSINSANQTIQ